MNQEVPRLVCPKGHCTHSGKISDLSDIAKVFALDWRKDGEGGFRGDEIHCPYCGEVMDEITPTTIRAANTERKKRGQGPLAVTSIILGSEDDIPY